MRAIVFAILTAAAAVACSSSSNGAGSASDAGAESAVVGCGGDSRAQAYAAGMGQKGESGTFRFELLSATPEPVTPDTQSWVLRITDAAGKPVTDATFPATPSSPDPRPWMPMHGHGTSLVTVTNHQDGTYTLSPLYMYMPGLWETDIAVTSGGKSDATKFFFCLQ